LESAELEIKKFQEKNEKDHESHKEELKKYQKFIEEKAGVHNSLEKKLQKFEENYTKLLAEYDLKNSELFETSSVFIDDFSLNFQFV